MWKGRGSVRGDEKERYNRTIGQWRVKFVPTNKIEERTRCSQYKSVP